MAFVALPWAIAAIIAGSKLKKSAEDKREREARKAVRWGEEQEDRQRNQKTSELLAHLNENFSADAVAQRRQDGQQRAQQRLVGVMQGDDDSDSPIYNLSDDAVADKARSIANELESSHALANVFARYSGLSSAQHEENNLQRNFYADQNKHAARFRRIQTEKKNRLNRASQAGGNRIMAGNMLSTIGMAMMGGMGGGGTSEPNNTADYYDDGSSHYGGYV